MPRLPLRTRRHCDFPFKPYVELLEERALPSGWHFDFGTGTSPVAPGYTDGPAIPYDSTIGYGWQTVSGITAVDRGMSDSVSRDFHQAHDGTFQANVANGTYEADLYLND